MGIKSNIIDGAVKQDSPKLFYPNRYYFASMSNSKTWIKGYGSLVQNVLQRFPFQPKMPGFHPALRYNFQALRSIKGETFRYHMKRIEEQFFQLIKEHSRHKDMAFRKLARRLFLMLERELHVNRMIDAREKYYYKLFENKAVKTHGERHRKVDAWVKKIYIAADELREFYKEIDKEHRAVVKKYWEDYDKNREIKPRVISMGGASLQSILNELPWAEASSLWRVFEMVKENKLNLYSEQIAESFDGVLPTELMSKKIYFNRRLWEQFQRELKKIELYEKNKEFNLTYMDERLVKTKFEYEKFVKATLKRSEDFMEYWDHINEEWPLRLSTSSTNYTEALGKYRRASAAVIHNFKERVAESFMIARADTLIESMSHSIPSEVLFNYGVYHPHRVQRKPFDPEDMKAIRHQQKKENETLRFWKDREAAIAEVKESMIQRMKEESKKNVEKADEKTLVIADMDKKYLRSLSSDIDDKLKNDRAPRANPEASERRRKVGEANFPKYTKELQFVLAYNDDTNRSDIKSVAQFHAMRRNDARLEDHAVQTDETVRQKADWHNKVYKERSGSTDSYFKNRWASNHNESLIPINFADQQLRELVKPITDSSDFTPIQEPLREVAKTYSPESIKKHKKK